MVDKIRVLVVGCGNMGASHARAYSGVDGFEVVGLVDRAAAPRGALAAELGGPAEFDDIDAALEALKPDAAAICTYPDSHALFATKCLEAGAHVFAEKPLATSVEEVLRLRDADASKGATVVVDRTRRFIPPCQEIRRPSRRAIWALDNNGCP